MVKATPVGARKLFHEIWWVFTIMMEKKKGGAVLMGLALRIESGEQRVA